MNSLKITIWVALAAVLSVAIYGAYLYPKVAPAIGTSPAGTTGQTAKLYSVTARLASPGANATSSSVLNTTGNDLYVTGIVAGCESVGTSKTAYTGTGLSALTLSVATTSTSAPTTVTSNLVGGSALTIATSSPQFSIASTTAQGGTGVLSNIWTAGSYMTFTTNATNTAQCTFGVTAFSS